jgi:hypothetical protein
MRSEKGRQDEWIELTLTRWLAVRAHGAGAIRATVFIVLWLTALGLVYLLWHSSL